MNDTDLPEGLLFDKESLILSGTINEIRNNYFKLLFDPPIELRMNATDPVGKSKCHDFSIEVEISSDYIYELLWRNLTVFLS